MDFTRSIKNVSAFRIGMQMEENEIAAALILVSVIFRGFSTDFGTRDCEFSEKRMWVKNLYHRLTSWTDPLTFYKNQSGAEGVVRVDLDRSRDLRAGEADAPVFERGGGLVGVGHGKDDAAQAVTPSCRKILQRAVRRVGRDGLKPADRQRDETPDALAARTDGRPPFAAEPGAVPEIGLAHGQRREHHFQPVDVPVAERVGLRRTVAEEAAPK